MRKLATVTAAAALVAATFMFLAASAFAGPGQSKDEVVILKCVEFVTADLNNLESSITSRTPVVLLYEATISRPDDCGLGDACSGCLKTLLADSMCVSGQFPGSPLKVAEVNEYDFATQELEHFAIEEYVFQCKG